MFHGNAFSPKKRNSNRLPLSIRSNLRYGLIVILVIVGICWSNSPQVNAATKVESECKNAQVILSASKLDLDSDDNFHDCQHHHHSGFLPRIISRLIAPFWTQSVDPSQSIKQVKPPQNISNFSGMGGSLNQNLTPLYLSKATSLTTQESGRATIKPMQSPVTSLPSVLTPKLQTKLQTYTVKTGDTINHIAQKHRVSRDEIIKFNNIENSNIIFVNQQLQIPVTTSQDPNYKISVVNTRLPSAYIAGDRLQVATPNRQQPLKKNKFITSVLPQSSQNLDSVSQEKIPLQLPPLPSPEEYLPNAFDGYAWPAQGVLTSGYGWRWGRLHKGIDIAGPVGTPVFAAASGEVISAGWNSGGYGNLIKLQHLDGSVTVYAHNNKILVSSGQKVTQGDQIAEMGNTGFSTGSHLHFEIHSREQGVVNPLALLK